MHPAQASSAYPDPAAADAGARRARDYGRIERALEWLASRDLRQPDLSEAARVVHMSPYHFQRVFSRWAGVSPKQFLKALSVARAKQSLADGCSVFEAALDAGLSGPGRLHDTFVNVEAVTPGEFKRGFAGVAIGYGFHPSPFGECAILATERGICALGFVCDRRRAATLRDLAARFPGARLSERQGETGLLAAQIFRAPGAAGGGGPLKLFLNGTRFQIQVWRALLEIPAGACTSYAAIARRLGNPQAVRAVGSANGANPVAYLIPCHRVIRKTGALGGYHWGLGRKLAILGQEALAAPLSCGSPPLAAAATSRRRTAAP